MQRLPYGGMVPQAVAAPMATPMAPPLTNTGLWTWPLNPDLGPGTLQDQQRNFVQGPTTHAASSERLPLNSAPIPANTARPNPPHGTGVTPTASAGDAGPVATPSNQGSSQRGASRPRSPSRGAEDEGDADVELLYFDGNYLGDGYVDLPDLPDD